MESRPPIEHACALFHQWATCDGWMARVTERRRGFIRVVICPQTDGALLGAGSSSSSSLHASNAVMQLAQPEQPVCARPRRPPFAQLVVCGRSCQREVLGERILWVSFCWIFRVPVTLLCIFMALDAHCFACPEGLSRVQKVATSNKSRLKN